MMAITSKIIYSCIFMFVFFAVYSFLEFIVEPFVIHTVCNELVICNGNDT